MNNILGNTILRHLGDYEEYGLHYKIYMHYWWSMEVWERSPSAGQGALFGGEGRSCMG